MKIALKDKPAVPFRVPPGIKLVRVNLATGARAQPGDQRVILEAFKPGTAPPDSMALVGYNNPEGAVGTPLGGGRPWGVGVSPDADRAVRTGTGGLY
jgi:penicillin-binding protein 1A